MGGHGDLLEISLNFLGDCVMFMRHEVLNQIFLVINSTFVSMCLQFVTDAIVLFFCEDKCRVGQSNDIIL